MSNPPQNISPNDDQNTINEELTHITQEMYKKNLELTERNKMLALLRKIDQIILSSLTNVEQIADQVTHTIIKDTSIKSVFIYLLDNDNSVLTPLSIAFNKSNIQIADDYFHIYYNGKIQLTDGENPMVKSIRERKIINEIKLSTFYPQISQEIIAQTQKEVGIEWFVIHPFYIRNETAGIIVFGFGHKEITFQYWDDFIVRLPQVISIAINNAMLYKKIEESNDQLRELDKLKDEFVSVASHELRTPMTAIKSYLWMALNKSEGTMHPEVKKFLDIAATSTDRLLHLVENMLTISRIEGNRLVLKSEPVNLLEMTEQIYNELRIKAQEKKIHFGFNSDVSDVIVTGDTEKLREALQNLVGNALKFTPEEGTITTTLTQNGNQIIIQIFNSGSFISSENITKLFEKFRKIESSYTNKVHESGSGLGLYICKQIVEMHKGRIEVDSEESKGTTFTVYIPAAIK